MILSVIRHFAEEFVILGSEFFKMLILYYSSSTRLGPTGNLNTWMKNYHIEMEQLFSFVTMILKA